MAHAHAVLRMILGALTRRVLPFATEAAPPVPFPLVLLSVGLLVGLLPQGMAPASPAGAAPPIPHPARPVLAQPPSPAAQPSPAEQKLSLRQVLELGLAASARLERADRQIARDEALVQVNRALRLPQLNLVGAASYTQVGTSVGVLTNLPTFGDLSLSLQQNGYAVLQNSFANAGLLLDVDLLPLRQGSLLAASRASAASSRSSLLETERQVVFELVSSYRQLQLSQALVPVWEAALVASTALERDAERIQRRGLAARIDVLRARALRAGDVRGLAEAQAQLAQNQDQLAILLAWALPSKPQASDPIEEQPAWPNDLERTLGVALQARPLLQSLRWQQQAQRQQARAARAGLYPSIALVAGGGFSGDRLAAPVLNQGGQVNGPLTLPLPALEQSANASGSFYNWGVALLVRQPLYDGGRSASGAAVAEREAALLQADEELARRQIRDSVAQAWNRLAAAPEAIAAGREAVRAGERALRDAQLRYRAMVEPLTEVLLVQRDLLAARASLLTNLTRQAIDRAVLVRETGREP